MYRITFYTEASAEIEQNRSEMQEIALEKAQETIKDTHKFLLKTSHFLHKVLDQPNCIRIYINKN